MKKLLGIIGVLMFCALAHSAALTASVTWTAPTTNTDGSKITGALTYNLYSGPTATTPFTTVVQKGMTNTITQVMSGLTAGTQTCFAATAVVATIESAQSTAACITPAASPPPTLTPTPPGKVTVTP